MTPSAKFNTLLTGATVFTMYWIVAFVAPFLKDIKWAAAVMLSTVALLTSAGFFRLLTLLLRSFMENSVRIRRFVLGPHYMHGTWVGWFKGHSGDKRYMVEYFSQNLDSLVITGRSFTDTFDPHGQWKSESTAIDVKHGQLLFTYIFNVITHPTALAGVHTSVFERRSPNNPPTAISGFAHDMNDSTRIAVHSEWISDENMPWKDALKIAKDRFK